jgi:hypothetical protein
MFDSHLHVSSNENGDWLHGGERSQRQLGRTADSLSQKAGRYHSSQPLFHKCCCFTAGGPLRKSPAVASGWACAALVNKRKGSGRGFQVVSAEPLDPKSARFNQVVNLSVEMAAAAEPFPHRS